MSILSILKTIGSSFGIVATKAVQIEAATLPVQQNIATTVGIFNPGAGLALRVGEATLQGLISIIGMVQQVATAVGAAQGTGPQKLAVAAPMIEAALLADPLFKGKNIADTTKWNTAVLGITSNLADLANSVEAAAVPTIPTALPATTISKT